MNNINIEIKFDDRYEAYAFIDLLELIEQFLNDYDRVFGLGGYFTPGLISKVREQIFLGTQKDQELEEDEVY